MSNILKFPTENTIAKNSFKKKLEDFHISCIDTIQKTDEYIRDTDRKLYLRNLFIKEYNVAASLVDELIETTANLIALEYDYVNYHMPDLFLDKI